MLPGKNNNYKRKRCRSVALKLKYSTSNLECIEESEYHRRRPFVCWMCYTRSFAVNLAER